MKWIQWASNFFLAVEENWIIVKIEKFYQMFFIKT